MRGLKGSRSRVKKEIRNRILSIRDRIPLDIKLQKDLWIENILFNLQEFLTAKAILLYASFRSEVSTPGIILKSLAMKKRILLPKVDSKNSFLKLYEIQNLAELLPGFAGIPEPDLPDSRLASIDDSDVAVIPGAVFDLSGNRIGYGAGYYDILLASRKKRFPLVALAYEEQIVHPIPSEKHDVRVDVIVTDKRVIRIANNIHDT